jgi:oligopeptide transport system ATP-binding protein
MPLLEVNGLQTQFFTQDGVVKAVDGISFYVNEGETLGIVGESGCGKSVSVLSVMRLIPQPPGKIVGGEVLFEGEDLLKISDNEIRRVRGNKIAMIFQDPMTSLNPVLTIGRQIQEALELHMGMNKEESRKRSAELLSMVGIPEADMRLDDYPHQFSGGMRQRAMIAMGLACNPQLLIADEPTTALDVTIQAQIVELVKRLRDEIGMAIIWITHDLGVVAGLADRMMVMYAGHVVEEAPVKEVYADPRHPYTLGLLGSLPRLDEIREERLTSIEGLPPDLIDLPPGCPFEPRCAWAVDKCKAVRPVLEPVGPRHRIACWVDVTKEHRKDAARAVPVESIAPAEPPVPLVADDLEIIEGIGPKIAQVLQAAGIVTFGQLATAKVGHIQQILGEADPKLLNLADPTTWPRQAQMAVEGKWDELQTLQDELKGGRQL